MYPLVWVQSLAIAIPHPAQSGGAGASVALPDLLAPGAARAPSYKRQISRPLRLFLRSSSITVCPAGKPASKAFDATGNTAHSEAERPEASNDAFTAL
jgi:hypothetical protein